MAQHLDGPSRWRRPACWRWPAAGATTAAGDRRPARVRRRRAVLVVTGERTAGGRGPQLPTAHRMALAAPTARLDGRDRLRRGPARARRDPDAVMGSLRRRPRDRRRRRALCRRRRDAARPTVAARRLAGHDRHQPTGERPAAFGYVRQGAAWPGTTARARASRSSSRSRRSSVTGRTDRSPSRGPPATLPAMFVRPCVLLDLLAGGTPASPARCADRGRPAGSTSSGRRCRGSPSTTPSPSRRRGRAGSPPVPASASPWDDIGDFRSLADVLARRSTRSTLTGSSATRSASTTRSRSPSGVMTLPFLAAAGRRC